MFQRPLLIILALLCSSCISYPSDYHLYHDLKSFRAAPIEQISGDTYRLIWHAWHKQPGLLTANCEASSCFLSIKYTAGYGSYQQGKLAGSAKTKISRAEFETIANGFTTGNFSALTPSLRTESRFKALKPAKAKDEIIICMHAPHYYLESYVGGNYHLIYRYCQKNYQKDLEVAFPLIDLAGKYFPEELGRIKAAWVDNAMSRF